MKTVEILKRPIHTFRRHKTAVSMALLIIVSAALYPSDMKNDYSIPRGGESSFVVMLTDKYARHLNTLLPIIEIVVQRDLIGIKQLLVVAGAGILATHGPKRLLNNVTVMGTRLGQRPNSPTSKHNMPSGHSSLASTGAYFTMRRCNKWFGLIVIPIMFLTMYARVMLDKHTISATIAGAMIGILVTALFTTKNPGRRLKKSAPDHKLI